MCPLDRCVLTVPPQPRCWRHEAYIKRISRRSSGESELSYIFYAYISMFMITAHHCDHGFSGEFIVSLGLLL